MLTRPSLVPVARSIVTKTESIIDPPMRDRLGEALRQEFDKKNQRELIGLDSSDPVEEPRQSADHPHDSSQTPSSTLLTPSR